MAGNEFILPRKPLLLTWVLFFCLLSACQTTVTVESNENITGNTSVIVSETPTEVELPVKTATRKVVEEDDIESVTPEVSVSTSIVGDSSTTEILVPQEQTGACDEEAGLVEINEIESTFQTDPFRFRIYLPPCYNADSQEGYPVLYLLHGQGYNDDQWDRLKADEIANQMISSNCWAPFIMVMPWEKDNLIDSWESDFDSILLEELIPWVDEHYATCDERECRAIGGISRGAAWAMRLGLMNWEYFSAIGSHSFPPFKNDFYLLPDWLMAFPSDQRPRIYVDIGNYDRYLTAANEFQTTFVTYRLPYEWHSFEGMHNEEYWSAHIRDYLEWYVQPWNTRAGFLCEDH